MKILLTLILFSGTALAQATPQWFTVGKEAGVFTAPKGTVVRFGSPVSVYAAASGTYKIGDASAEAWTSPKTLDADTVFTANTAYFGDPIYGVAKVVQVERTAADQTIRYAAPDGSPAINVLVAALPTPPAPTITLPVPGGVAMGCYSQIVTSKDDAGNAVQEYFVIICGNPPKPAS